MYLRTKSGRSILQLLKDIRRETDPVPEIKEDIITEAWDEIMEFTERLERELPRIKKLAEPEEDSNPDLMPIYLALGKLLSERDTRVISQ